MIQTIKKAWAIPELRKKIVFTALMLLIFRIGNAIPVPYVNTELLGEYLNQLSTTVLGLYNVMSGGAFANATVFALGVQPYINSSIIIQLLTIAIPALERMARDGGEEGKKKIQSITRYATVAIAILQGWGYYVLMKNYGILTGSGVWVALVIIVSFIAGSSFVMWMGEQITEFGIGNGISIILFANIISRLPAMAESLWKRCFTSDVVVANSTYKSVGLGAKLSGAPLYIVGSLLFLLFIAILLFFTVLVVWFSNSERRIPVQYAKRVVGRKMYGGQSSTLPIKLDMSGVMPIIFASSIVSIPSTIAGFGGTRAWATWINDFLGYTSFPYIAIYLILIVAFAYFYIMISFNPVEVANNLQQNGGAVPGIRPGRPTVAYITKILNRITLLGALFLIVLSGVPMIVNAVWYSIDGYGLSELAFSGSSLLIVVGVALDTGRSM